MDNGHEQQHETPASPASRTHSARSRRKIPPRTQSLLRQQPLQRRTGDHPPLRSRHQTTQPRRRLPARRRLRRRQHRPQRPEKSTLLVRDCRQTRRQRRHARHRLALLQRRSDQTGSQKSENVVSESSGAGGSGRGGDGGVY